MASQRRCCDLHYLISEIIFILGEAQPGGGALWDMLTVCMHGYKADSIADAWEITAICTQPICLH